MGLFYFFSAFKVSVSCVHFRPVFAHSEWNSCMMQISYLLVCIFFRCIIQVRNYGKNIYEIW
jgi:hypothetical protein